MPVKSPKVAKSGSGVSDHMHWGVRIAVLDLTRATEQTVLSISGLVGRTTERFLNQKASQALTGYLEFAATAAPFELVYPDRKDTKSLRSSVSLVDAIPDKVASGRSLRRLEVCASPIDGKFAAWKGIEGGSISVLTAGAPGTFRDPEANDPTVVPSAHDDRFLVVAVSPSLLRMLPDQSLPFGSIAEAAKSFVLSDEPDIQKRTAKPGKYAQEFASAFETLLNLPDLAVAARGDRKMLIPAAAVVAHKVTDRVLDEWVGSMRQHFRIRYLFGSSVAGCLTALMQENETRLAVVVSRTPHVIQVATAAKALGGEIWAIKLEPVTISKIKNREKVSKSSKIKVQPETSQTADEVAETSLVSYKFSKNAIWRQASDFCHGNHACFVASGITDHPALRGVGFRADGRAIVSTLCLTVGTRSRRSLRHHVDMDRYMVYGALVHGAAAPLSEVLTKWQEEMVAAD